MGGEGGMGERGGGGGGDGREGEGEELRRLHFSFILKVLHSWISKEIANVIPTCLHYRHMQSTHCKSNDCVLNPLRTVVTNT